MAGKKKIETGPMLLPGLDLDEIDDFLDDKPRGNRTKDEAIREFKSAAGKSIKARLNTKAVLSSFMRYVLPDGYARLMGVYDDAKAEIETQIDKVEESEYASLEQLAEKFEDHLPKIKGKVSDAVYERIKNKIGDRKENYAMRRQLDAARGDKDPQANHDQAVDSMFAELSEAQLDMAKAGSDSEHSKLEYDVKRDGIRAKLDKSRFDVLNRHLGVIADSNQRTSAFNDTVTYQFQKKSLELQMRSYLSLRNLVQLTGESLKLQRDAYGSLVHNTGLPDFLKSTEAERIRFKSREKAKDLFGNAVSKTAGDFATNFIPNVFNNLGRKASGSIRTAADSTEGPVLQLLKMLMADPANAAGGMAGNKIADLFHNMVMPSIGRKAKPVLQKVSDKLTRGADSRIAYGLDNLGSMAQQFANDSTKSSGASGYLQDLVRAIIPQFKLDDLVRDNTYQTIGKEASFNQMTQRSIVEVIPGYLSRILHETRMIRTGDHSIERETYDITRGQFVSARTAEDNLGKRIIGQGARGNMRRVMNDTIGTFDSEGGLSVEAKHALEERLLRDAMAGQHFDPEQYVRMDGYAPGTSAAVLKELEGFFKSRFKFTEKGKLADEAGNYRTRQDLSVSFNTLRDSARSPVAEIESILSSGNHTVLREMGILVTVEGEDRIDYSVIRDLYRGLTDNGKPVDMPSPTGPLFKRLRDDLKKKGSNFRKQTRRGFKGTGERVSTALGDIRQRTQEGFEAGSDSAQAAVDALGKRVSDLTVVGKHGVKVSAQDILSGELIDVNTKKVIETVDDITGSVIDVAGNVRLSLADVKAGLLTRGGELLNPLKGINPKVPPALQAMLAQSKLSLTNTLTEPNGMLSRVKDLYIQGKAEPVIKATALRAGEYINMSTGAVLATIDDITGPIASVHKPEEILITTEEATHQLCDRNGKAFRSSKLLRLIGRVARGGLVTAANLVKIGFGLVKWAVKRVITLDAYLPGSREPVLTTGKLNRGEYYHADGSVIKHFDDLRDGVYGPDQNLVLSPEEIPHLVNRDGSKHTAAKKRSWARRALKTALIRAPKAVGKWLGRKWWNGTKAYYKGMGNVIGKMAGMAGSEQAPETPTDGILARILGVLDKRLPKEEARKGSWQAQLAEQAEQEEKKKAGKEEAKASGKGLGGLLAGLKNVFGGNKQEDEEEDDDDGDTNVYVEGDGKDKDKKKKKKPRKPKGRFGRGMDKLKNSKVGKWGGRVRNARAMQGLLRFGGSALNVARGGMMLSGMGMLGTGGMAAVGTGLGGMVAGAGTMLAAAGTAILGILGSPIVLTALAVGAVATVGYFLWKRYSSVSGDFRELRLLQYGIDSTSDKLKVLKLEGLLEKHVDKSPTPQLNMNMVNPKEIFEVMKIDPNDEGAIPALAQWIEGRFKPVFLAYKRMMNSLASADMVINDLDDKLPEDLKHEFALGVQSVPPEVYQVMVDPFDPKEQLEVSAQDIAEKFSDVLSKWKDKARPAPEEKNADGTEKPATAATAGSAANDASKPPRKPSMTDRLKQVGKTALLALPGGLAIAGLLKAVKGDFFSGFFSKAKTAVMAATPALLGGLVLKSAVSMVGKALTGKLTTLQAVRVRAYGRLGIDSKTVQALFETEAKLFEGVKFQTDGQAYFDGSLDVLIGNAGNYFGVDVTDAEDKTARRFTKWLLQRFIPVALAYFAAVRAKAQSVTPSRVESTLDDAQKLDVANAVMTATYEINGDQVSIWKADTFFDNNGASADALKAAAQVEIAELKAAVDKAKLATPTSTVQDQQNQSKSGIAATAAKIFEGARSLAGQLKDKLVNFHENVANKAGAMVNSVKDFFGFGEKPPQQPGQLVNGGTYTPGGVSAQRGEVFTGFAEGNGGQWNLIPLPKANKSREAAMDTLRAVQAMTGVDAELLATFCSIESGFDYLIKARTSSATGWFQFINDTWDGMLREHASKYGVPSDNSERYLRKDPRINALMGAEFLKGNYKVLARGLGRAPTDTDLYCAHFMGAGTAVGFLNRDQNAVAARFYPEQAAANRPLYYKSTGQARTVGEMYALFEDKVRKHRRGGTGTDVAKSSIGEPDAQAVADMQAAAVAKGTDLGDTANDAVNGEVGVGSATDTSSINMVADRAAGPLRMDPTQTNAPTVASGTGVSTTVTSGQDDAGRNEALKFATLQAEQADKARATEVRQKQELASASINYQERQLETQIQMRDLLRIIAAKAPANTAGPVAQTPASSGVNDMGNNQQQVRERKPGNLPLPLSFGR